MAKSEIPAKWWIKKLQEQEARTEEAVGRAIRAEEIAATRGRLVTAIYRRAIAAENRLGQVAAELAKLKGVPLRKEDDPRN